MTTEGTTHERFLDERLDTIWEGVRDAIRAEVRELERLHLPIYVSDHGRVIDLNASVDGESRGRAGEQQ